MDDENEDLTPPPISRGRRVAHIIAWGLSLMLLGGLIWSMMSFQCICGHSAMNAPLGGSIFGGATLTGAVLGWQYQKTSRRPGVGVLLAILLMFGGTVAALMFAGNDLHEAHRNAFQPASPEMYQQVTF